MIRSVRIGATRMLVQSRLPSLRVWDRVAADWLIQRVVR